jgi:hypothetical protein
LRELINEELFTVPNFHYQEIAPARAVDYDEEFETSQIGATK